MNPASDVSSPILGSIRETVNIPLDVYIIIVDFFGGMFRAYEAPEIARISFPCYFKYEPGASVIFINLGYQKIGTLTLFGKRSKSLKSYWKLWTDTFRI